MVSFGDFRKARVATLGWNPSKNEFLDRSGRELDGDDRRLETWQSIGRSQIQNPRANAAADVWNGCQNYFRGNPYHWFNKLEQVLRGVRASYKNGTACHLDLVQWATDPVWRDLSDRQKQELLDADVPFLGEQLAHSKIEALLLNGRGIVEGVRDRLGVKLESRGKLPGHRSEFFSGRTRAGVLVVGWSTNLQSSRGVSAMDVRMVRNRVKSMLEGR